MNSKDIFTCATCLGNQSFVRYRPNSNILRLHLTAFVIVTKNKNDTNFPPKCKISTYFLDLSYCKVVLLYSKMERTRNESTFLKLYEIVLNIENIKKLQKFQIALSNHGIFQYTFLEIEVNTVGLM